LLDFEDKGIRKLSRNVGTMFAYIQDVISRVVFIYVWTMSTV